MKSKRICLVTWMGTGNFGTSLQSYALHRKLEEMGYDVTFLKPFSEEDFKLTTKVVKSIKRIKTTVYQLFHPIKKRKKLQAFNKENYNTKEIHTPNEYANLMETTDVFVTGSDQIWNCYHSFSPFMFLAFAGEAKRIAYASSIGTKGFPPELQNVVRQLLMKFSHIGVREQDAVETIASLTGREDIVQVLDPTFLLDSTAWAVFSSKAQIETETPKRFALCYFIGQNDYWQQVRQVCNGHDIIDIIVIPSIENADIAPEGMQLYTEAGPYEFVKLLREASLVLTDSFHACALSINMSRQFVVFKRFADTDNRSQNSRIYNLLAHYGLSDRLYNGGHSFGEIDYAPVCETLNKDRLFSTEWLEMAIEK